MMEKELYNSDSITYNPNILGPTKKKVCLAWFLSIVSVTQNSKILSESDENREQKNCVFKNRKLKIEF